MPSIAGIVENLRKTFLLLAACVVGCPSWANEPANDVKLGVLMGFTGPIESVTADFAAGAEFAMREASESGEFLSGAKLVPLRADSGCIDNGLAVANAEKLLPQGAVGIVGGICSGITSAVLQNVAIPNGLVMISPAASSPGLTDIEDQNLFFRTVSSDIREGQVMAGILKDRGVASIALTYTNNDYGVGLANAIAQSFEASGGEVTIVASHTDGQADYSSEVSALAAAGGEVLVVAGYVDQGGTGIVRTALETGAFDLFGLPSGMVGGTLLESTGSGLNGSFGQTVGAQTEGIEKLHDLAGDELDATLPLVAESYDAAALMILAMQAAGSSAPHEYKEKIVDVANAPGVKIFPGQLERGLALLAAGKEIDYVGASDVELTASGESLSSFREVEVRNGIFETVGYR